MERITLPGLVKLAKSLAADKSVYTPGMEIKYTLNPNEFDLLQLEVYQHTYGREVEFIPRKKFEFEIMEVYFTFTKAT